jgi:predicted DNA-binding antitoxin AbrB/MazE fold protein
MSQSVRAVYHKGQLRPLDPVDLSEGQEVQLVILSERERMRAALRDLLVEYDSRTDSLDEDALMREIDTGFRGQPPLSETIIDERREGT